MSPLHKLFGFISQRRHNKGVQVSVEKVVRSIPERWLDPGVRRHVSDMRLIRQACVETYRWQEDLPPSFRPEMHFARRHVYRLRDVAVNARTGACGAGGYYFQESYGSLRRCLLEKPFPAGSGRSRHADGPVTSVHGSNFYHFLLEEVPRLLWALQHVQDLTVMVHAGAASFVFELLDTLRSQGHLQRDLLVVEDDVIVLPQYVFTQAEAYSGFVHSSDQTLLRKHFLRPLQSVLPARRIYISRQGCSRAFCNEADICSSMSNAGFEICRLESLSLNAQTDLFASASQVVAPHGAGLANLLWCAAGTRVLEIFSPIYFNDCYARLSCQGGLSYAPVWARESKGWGEVSPAELLQRMKVLDAEPSLGRQDSWRAAPSEGD